MSKERKDLGRLGENEAVGFLRKNRYKIIGRNYATPFGEIDIIAKQGNAVIFVEVKSRSSPLFGLAQSKITKDKKEKIIKSALTYLKKHNLTEEEARIDVVAVNFDKTKRERFELIEDAFGIEE